ncbi:ATP-binding protein [Brevibacterium casei]|nr:ATP-binding protein [Brevibacterium casei]
MSEHGEGAPWPGAAGQSAARLIRPPELILMVGLAGAGKSTRAAELAASLPAVRLSPTNGCARSSATPIRTVSGRSSRAGSSPPRSRSSAPAPR